MLLGGTEVPCPVALNDEFNQVNCVSAVTEYPHAADWRAKPIAKVQINKNKRGVFITSTSPFFGVK
jgi:hypothetical protein